MRLTVYHPWELMTALKVITDVHLESVRGLHSTCSKQTLTLICWLGHWNMRFLYTSCISQQPCLLCYLRCKLVKATEMSGACYALFCPQRPWRTTRSIWWIDVDEKGQCRRWWCHKLFWRSCPMTGILTSSCQVLVSEANSITLCYCRENISVLLQCGGFIIFSVWPADDCLC